MAPLTELSLCFYLFVKNSSHDNEMDFVSLFFCLLAFWTVGLQAVTKSYILFQELVIRAAQMMLRMEVVLEHLNYSEKMVEAISNLKKKKKKSL